MAGTKETRRSSSRAPNAGGNPKLRALSRSIAVLLGGGVLGCGGDGAPAPSTTPAPARSFALAFTAFPHARSLAALADAQAVIARDADMEALHFDDGVPWAEALAGAPYHPDYAADLERQVRSIPSGHVVYIAATPIAFERDRLAPHRGAASNEPLSPPWAGRAFDDPAVVDAFTNHCDRMVTIFGPRYFAYAIEANVVRRRAPEKWPALVRLCTMVYARLKARHPTLTIIPDPASGRLPRRPRRSDRRAPPRALGDRSRRGERLPLLRGG
jgi:hypothetical protein